MKKSIFLAAGLAALLNAGMLPSNVVNSGSLAQENGGAKTAIDAYSDGAGALLINQAADTKFDNSPMNKLVFKYGEEAKQNSVNLVQQVQTVSTTSSAQEKILAGSILTVVPPSCADVAMSWNGVTRLCEKGGVSTYAASGSLSGYTISGNSNPSVPVAFLKGINGFYFVANTCTPPQTSATAFLRPDGTLSNSIQANGSGLIISGAGFATTSADNAGYLTGPTIYKVGSSISASSTTSGYLGTYGFVYRTTTTFSYSNGPEISWEPLYNGSLTCPSGGVLSGATCTLNTFTTAPGICQSGYTMNNFQCFKN